MLVAQLHEHIQKHRLMQPGDRVAVAVSGGADSVALLRLLLELRSELGIALSVAHFNHQIRGAESDGDAAFVAAMAQKFELELHSVSGDASAHARRRQQRETRQRPHKPLLRAPAHPDGNHATK